MFFKSSRNRANRLTAFAASVALAGSLFAGCATGPLSASDSGGIFGSDSDSGIEYSDSGYYSVSPATGSSGTEGVAATPSTSAASDTLDGAVGGATSYLNGATPPGLASAGTGIAPSTTEGSISAGSVTSGTPTTGTVTAPYETYQVDEVYPAVAPTTPYAYSELPGVSYSAPCGQPVVAATSTYVSNPCGSVPCGSTPCGGEYVAPVVSYAPPAPIAPVVAMPAAPEPEPCNSCNTCDTCGPSWPSFDLCGDGLPCENNMTQWHVRGVAGMAFYSGDDAADDCSYFGLDVGRNLCCSCWGIDAFYRTHSGRFDRSIFGTAGTVGGVIGTGRDGGTFHHVGVKFTWQNTLGNTNFFYWAGAGPEYFWTDDYLDDDNGFGLYGEIGLGYNLNDNWRIRAGLNFHAMDTDVGRESPLDDGDSRWLYVLAPVIQIEGSF